MRWICIHGWHEMEINGLWWWVQQPITPWKVICTFHYRRAIILKGIRRGETQLMGQKWRLLAGWPFYDSRTAYVACRIGGFLLDACPCLISTLKYYYGLSRRSLAGKKLLEVAAEYRLCEFILFFFQSIGKLRIGPSTWLILVHLLVFSNVWWFLSQFCYSSVDAIM